MNKKRSFIKRFSQNIRRIPRRIECFSSRLDTSFGRVIFGDEDSSYSQSPHVIATVAGILVFSYGGSRLFGSSLVNRLPGLGSDGLLASGWGGMLVILLVLTGMNTVTLLLLVDRQHRGDDSVTRRLGTAIAVWTPGGHSQAPAKPDQRS
ncbi:hypothetical protein HRE53_30775 (plasmid) [Acaryochloris sp. 'Moss Beach']|uniref:hypothetical protein n=1 Tax=Acaryochloris sp. 'Moss Beach' TaxID=2740837 RepID=UPI001F2366EA|nr:hypothetical protein [Acaryochloris sp. 'Moss Beach']UJB73100.1 hypothetical protein HRE53_30775 [Acaryochloris sp. 'Moss Beach']